MMMNETTLEHMLLPIRQEYERPVAEALVLGFEGIICDSVGNGDIDWFDPDGNL